jgi:type IV secretory pathway protease TraF
MKRTFMLMAMVIALVVSSMSMAFANPTTVTDNASDSACFGQWRASSVQDLTDAGYVVGRDFFSERKANNATMNAYHRDVDCA